MSKHYSRRRSLVILLLFSVLCLLVFPGRPLSALHPTLSLGIFAVLAFAAARALNIKERHREIGRFRWALLAYSSWIIVSAAMHYAALSRLEPSSYITVRRHTADWGLFVLQDAARAYLLFPLLLLLSIRLFCSWHDVHRKLHFVPVIIVPSLVVAIYQGFFDMDFMNIPYFAERRQASGLGFDANALGLSLWLLFPLCVLGVVVVRRCWKKAGLVVLALTLAFCVFLSGSRTGALGIGCFIVVLPWVRLWVNGNVSNVGRRLLFLCPFAVAILVGTLGVVALRADSSLYPTLAKRLSFSLAVFKRGGVKSVLRSSGRSHLWLQAHRLTMESPLSGWGPGGFCHNLDNVRWKHSEGTRRVYLDNANNHYLQMTSELGPLGGLFNLLLIVSPLWMFYRIRKRVRDVQERWTAGIAFAAVSIMLVLFMTGPHIMTTDVLWVFVLFLALLFATAIRYGFSFGQARTRGWLIVFAPLTVLFLVGTYTSSFGVRGHEATRHADWWPLRYEKNCYRVEVWKEGKVRWCGRGALLQIPITGRVPGEIDLRLVAHHPDIRLNPVKVGYGGKGGVTDSLFLSDHEWTAIEIPVTEDYVFHYTAPTRPGTTPYERTYLVLSLDVSRTWVPEQWGYSEDTRELGVAVLLPDL